VSRFADLLDRFFYRPDEDVGAFLELAPEVEAQARAGADEPVGEFLAFELAGESYAVPIDLVREIVKVPPITEVPRSQPGLLGVMNVRGEMVPVYDVSARLGLAPKPKLVRGPKDVERAARVVLLRDPAGDAGVLVDGVSGVLKLAASKVETPPNLGLERDCIAALLRKGDALVILLDVEQVLA
jgi:purine-binding chemotaxis protein CheW